MWRNSHRTGGNLGMNFARLQLSHVVNFDLIGFARSAVISTMRELGSQATVNLT